MSNLEFGLTLLIVGMGGTLVTLYLLTVLIKLVTRLLPVEDRDEEGDEF